MTVTWSESQDAAIIVVLDKMIEDGEAVRLVRDMLTERLRMAAKAQADRVQNVHLRSWGGRVTQVERAKTSAVVVQQES